MPNLKNDKIILKRIIPWRIKIFSYSEIYKVKFHVFNWKNAGSMNLIIYSKKDNGSKKRVGIYPVIGDYREKVREISHLLKKNNVTIETNNDFVKQIINES